MLIAMGDAEAVCGEYDGCVGNEWKMEGLKSLERDNVGVSRFVFPCIFQSGSIHRMPRANF